MQVVRITTETQLQHLRPHWNALAGDVPFRCWEWLHPWWRHYGAGRELYVLAVYDCQQVLRGVAPWLLEKSARRGRALRLLGSGEVCSDHLGILADDHHADQVAAVLADWLTQHAGQKQTAGSDPRWDVLELAAVDADDRAVQRLLAGLRQRGCAVDCRPGPRCWVIDLPETWEEYLARLSKSHRKKLKRLGRSGFSGAGTRVCRTVDAQSLRTGMEILVDLHQRRRRALGDPGCFASPQFSRFLHDAAAALADANRLNLYWVESEGRPLAAEFQLLSETTVYAYQAGMDPARLDRQPGRLTCIAGIRQALGAGRTQFDFLRGDEPYKSQWGASARPSLNVRVAAPKPLAWARHLTWLAGRRAKQAIKDGLAALRAAPAADPGRGPGKRPPADRSARAHPGKGDTARGERAAASEPRRDR